MACKSVEDSDCRWMESHLLAISIAQLFSYSQISGPLAEKVSLILCIFELIYHRSLNIGDQCDNVLKVLFRYEFYSQSSFIAQLVAKL